MCVYVYVCVCVCVRARARKREREGPAQGLNRTTIATLEGWTEHQDQSQGGAKQILAPLESLNGISMPDAPDRMCTAFTSLEPLGSCPRLLDLGLPGCSGLPPSALAPLSCCTLLKLLDITDCSTFDLAPLASCRDLRRLYIARHQRDLDLKPLRGLMPRLEVRKGNARKEDLDARDLLCCSPLAFAPDHHHLLPPLVFPSPTFSYTGSLPLPQPADIQTPHSLQHLALSCPVLSSS